MNRVHTASRVFATLAGAVILLAAGPASARTEKWVSAQTGSDTNDGDSAATAYKTLQHAIVSSEDGTVGAPSIIHVGAGTYLGSTPTLLACRYPAAIVVDGKSYLTIAGVPGAQPLLQPTAGMSLSISNSQHIVIDNLHLSQSQTSSSVVRDCMHVCDSTDVTVRGSTIGPGEDGIDASSDHTDFLIEGNVFTGLAYEALDFDEGAYAAIVIQDNVFEATVQRPVFFKKKGSAAIDGVTMRRNLFLGTTAEEAIRLIGAHNVRIENNVVMHSVQQGLYIDEGCGDVTVVHNTFFRNNRTVDSSDFGEIRTKVTGADIVIKNNIISGRGTNSSFQLPSATSSLLGEDYNLIFNTLPPPNFSYGNNDLFGDPAFVSATAGSEDLHLTSSSPAVASGADTLGVSEDQSGASRPNPPGTLPDRGAYEFSCDVPTPTVAADLTDAAGNVVGSVVCTVGSDTLSCQVISGGADQCGGN